MSECLFTSFNILSQLNLLSGGEKEKITLINPFQKVKDVQIKYVVFKRMYNTEMALL
jgi:hypothetical protein